MVVWGGVGMRVPTSGLNFQLGAKRRTHFDFPVSVPRGCTEGGRLKSCRDQISEMKLKPFIIFV